MNCELFPQTLKNGHVPDTLHAKGMAYITRPVSVRHSASYHNTRNDTYRQYRSTYTTKKTHWLAIHLQPRSYSGYFFDSIGLHLSTPLCWFYAPRVLRLEIQDDRAASVDHKSLRQILLSLRIPHGPWKIRGSLWASSMPPPVLWSCVFLCCMF